MKIKLLKDVIFKEGLLNYFKRKLNISYLDSKTVFTMHYKGKKVKIILNRKFGYVDMMIFRHGIYEKDIVDDISKEINENKTFIDIGANIGQHSLLMAPFAKKVYAFEPIPNVFKQFEQSIKLNKFNHIKAFNTAIGASKDSKTFNYVTNHAGTSSFVERENEQSSTITVQIDTLKNLLGDVKMDVVKIDVEGYEAVVVLGNKEKFIEDKPIVFFEFSPHWIKKEGTYTPEEVLSFFLDNHFNVFSRNINGYLKTLSDLDTNSQDNWIVKPNE